MAPRPRAGSRTKTKAVGKKPRAVKLKVKARAKSKPKRIIAKATKATRKLPKAAKPRAPKAAKPSAAKTVTINSRETRSGMERRQVRGGKGRRAPAFEHVPNFGAAARDDDYVYERDAQTAPRVNDESNDTYTPGDLVPGQVGEARPARPNGGRPNGGRGNGAVSRPRESETESVTVENGVSVVGSAKGGFDEGGGRESEIASEQPREKTDTPALKQDYGRPKTADGKPGE